MYRLYKRLQEIASDAHREKPVPAGQTDRLDRQTDRQTEIDNQTLVLFNAPKHLLQGQKRTLFS